MSIMVQKQLRRIGQKIVSTDKVRYTIEAILFMIILVLLDIGSVRGTLDTTQGTMLGLLFSILISIELLMQRVARIHREVTSRTGVIDPDDVRSRILDYLTESPPNTLYSIDYSSQRSKPIIERAIKDECTVYLLVRHPSRSLKWRVSKNQAQRTRSAIDDLLQVYGEHRDNGAKLHIQFYYQTGGLRARRMDNQRLYTGWYTFDNRNGKPPETKHVHGDNNPMVASADQDEGYEALNEMFESAFYAHWKEGCSLAESLNDSDVAAVYPQDCEHDQELAKEVSGVRAEEIFPEVDEERSLDDIEDQNIFVRPGSTKRGVD